jgi:hypothetical protein
MNSTTQRDVTRRMSALTGVHQGALYPQCSDMRPLVALSLRGLSACGYNCSSGGQ